MTSGAEAPGQGGPPAALPAATIHVLMGRILAELPPIAKSQRNAQQGAR